MTVQGRVKNGVVVLQNGAVLPEGSWVLVFPVPDEHGSASALIAAMEAEPHLSADDIAELQQAIAVGKRPAAAIDLFASDARRPA